MPQSRPLETPIDQSEEMSTVPNQSEQENSEAELRVEPESHTGIQSLEFDIPIDTLYNSDALTVSNDSHFFTPLDSLQEFDTNEENPNILPYEISLGDWGSAQNGYNGDLQLPAATFDRIALMEILVSINNVPVGVYWYAVVAQVENPE